MKKGKTNNLGRRILSIVLTVALVVGLMPGNMLTVKAEESTSTPLSVTAFATSEQLMSSDNFALHTDTGSGTAQKVYFGMNGESQQIWYIAGGEDHDGDGTKDSIVLLCDPSLPMATGTMFENDWENNKTYSADWRCTYETAPNEVYPNHYGASDLRGVLQGYISNDNTEKFSAAEKEQMQSTKVYTDDDKRKDEGETDYTYYTEDVLYPAYGDYNDNKYITVGANSADSLNGGLKVSLKSAPYNSGNIFWLRAPFFNSSDHALVATPGGYAFYLDVNLGYSVVPAFRLNLSSVLFASAATAATSGASLTDTMTFRVEGDDKITSKAYYSTDNVIVDAAEEETVYLYVQGKDGTTDWVYSQEVSADTTIATGTIKSGAKDIKGSDVSLTSVDLSQCEIWIEKKVTDDNLVYAVMANESETIATVAVTDITAPVAGAELDVAATCNTTGVSTTTPTVSYTKNGESVAGNAAGYLAGYTATVELEAAVDYAFTNETTATINGNEASVSYDADTGKLTVSYTFDKTAKLPPGNAYYVTKDELMSSFDLDGTDDTVGKVYFGTNGSNKQTWYIAGSDAADSIVLLCDPALPMATGTKFEDGNSNNKTYDSNWNCTYGTAPSEVYPNHYGASDLRGVLQGYTSNDNTEKFSAAEKELMQSTKVYTDDDKRKDEGETDYTYYTEDVLYPAYGDYHDDKYITVGANSADSLNGGLKVRLKSAPYNSGDIFWLRAPFYDSIYGALDARPGYYVGNYLVYHESSVVPAFRLNLSSVLFASAATAATSDASLTDTMTFRVDDTEKIKSKAAYATCGVTVNYDEGDGNVFLYVQDADSVYSVEITEDTTVALSDMTGIESLTAENTKIWLEKSEDNVAYALMAEAVLTEHIPNEDDGDCTTSITCRVCGTVTTEAEAEHIDDNGDGICDHCDSYVEPKQEDEYYQIANAGNLMWFVQQVNEGQTTINAKLTADIAMNGIDWTMMSSFAGTFDGNGHTISGLNGHIDMWAQVQCHGFIRTLDNGGFVKNLTFTGAKVFNHEGGGAISAIIVYTNNGTVENCVVKDSNIHHGDYDTIGVVVGANTGTIRNCASISNTMVRGFSSAKAICGFVWTNSGSIENCFNYDCTYQNGSNRYAFTQSNTGTITNCYYYESSETISDTVATAKTADQFASGEVAYLLNSSKSEGALVWGQKLKTDAYPVFKNDTNTVYYGYANCQSKEKTYSNVKITDEIPDHVWKYETDENSENKLIFGCATEGCTKGGTVTVTGPKDSIYNGSNHSATVSVETKENEELIAAPEITYTSLTEGVELVDGKPVNAGTYKASITLGEVTAYDEFEIAKATPYIKTVVAADAITYGATLKGSTLNGGVVQYSETDETAVAGTWSWKETTTKPVVADSNMTQYAVVFTPADTDNYNEVETKITLTVNPLATTPNMPKESMSALYSQKTVGVVELPEGWVWSENYSIKELTVGVAVEATAIYNGADKGNYVTESVVVSITREACTHAGENEVKDAKEATCGAEGYTGDAYCKDCGEIVKAGTVIPKAETHTGGTATCKDKAECTVCHETYGELDQDNHTGETEIRDAKEATGETEGYTGDTYCKDCGTKIKDGEIIPTQDSTYTGPTFSWSEDGKTCTITFVYEEDGTHTASYEATVTSEVKTEATCKDKGTTTYTATYTDTEKKYSEEGKTYTDTKDVADIPADETKHVESDIVYTGDGDKAPTCTEAGIGHTECTKCQKPMQTSVEVPATGHTGGTATCKNKAECSTCHEAYGELDKNNHTGETEVKDTREATCAEEGYTGDAYCKDCGEIVEAGTVIPKAETHTGGTATCKDKAECTVCHEAYGEINQDNHTGETEVRDAGEATCGAEGYTGDTYCKDCGTKIATGTKTDKAGVHAWDAGKVTKAPTATAEGEKTYTCGVCGETKVDKIPATGNTDIGNTDTGNTDDKNTNTDTKLPAVGEKITSEDGSATYQVTEAGENGGTVIYEAPTDKNATTVAIPATVTINNITYKVTAISDTAFAGNKKITSVTIGDNVTEFNAKTFKGCTNLKILDVGNGVTSIPANAFKNFKNLTTVKMGTGVKTIGKNAFSGCKKLKTVTVGQSVTKIGSKAFYGCSKLKTLTIKSTKLTTKKVGSKAFTKTPKNMTVKVPKKKFKAYKSMLIKRGVNKKAKFKKN